MQETGIVRARATLSALSTPMLRAAPGRVLRIAVGFLCGAAGIWGFAPLAMPALAAAWLCLPEAPFVLVGTLLGALASGSYASFSACALFGGMELLLSLLREPRGKRGELLRALFVMILAQAVLLPFLYPVRAGAFYFGLGCLLLSGGVAAVAARALRALADYLDGRRLARADALSLAVAFALLVGALPLASPIAAAGGLLAMLLAALAAYRARSCAAGALKKTRRNLMDAAEVAKGIALYVDGSAGGDTIAHSQLLGMGEAMEKLAAGDAALMRRRISLVSASAGVAMQGSPLTGDTMAMRRAGDMEIFVLSDGMGTGEAAHRESAMAAALLADMLSIGYPPEAAQRSVNDLLLLSGEEIYATLDAALVDLMTGELRMLKFGAPPSYVLREGRVRLIDCPALPAGILPEARAGECRTLLRRGDALVMMTDGLMEALGMELIAAIVERVGGANTVEDAANALIACGIERGYQDDMSVFVARVEQEGPGARVREREEAAALA